MSFSSNQLTANQKIKYEILSTFIARQGYYPSFSELAEIWGLKSKNAVAEIIKRLKVQGLIEQNKRGAIIKIAKSPLPLLGEVRAGNPSDSEDDDVVELSTIDDFLIRHREKTFLLKVEGDSMKDAGLLPGDIVVLEKGAIPKAGNIVVARVDNQWTIKYLQKNNTSKSWELWPANAAYKPIKPKGEMTITGVVIGSFRRY